MKRIAFGIAGLTAAGLVLTACGGSPKPASAPSSAAPSSASPSASGNSARDRALRPAASGTAAAVSPGSLEVQNPSQGQVTVNYTGSTAWSQTVSVTLAAVKAGECVSAFSTASSGSSSSTPATTFTASTVLISPKVGNTCTVAGAFGGGARPSGTRPSGFPSRPRGSGFPSGARPSGFPGAGGDRAVGTVTAVNASTITVDGRARTDTSNTTYTVHVDASTKYTETQKATSTAAKVGECVTAFGTTGTTGAVTATRIDLTQPVGGSCTTGFGRRGSGGTGG